VTVAPNLRPELETERLGPVRRALHEVFLRHVMARAPGYPRLQELCAAPVLPTPAAFGAALEQLAAARDGDVVAVDLGGATCDVFSVRRGEVYRSVSANLGLSFSLGAVCHRAGRAQVARWLPLAMTPEDLGDRIRNKTIRPTTVPQTPEDLLLEQAAAREALRLALADHAEALLPLRGARDGPTGVDALSTGASAERGAGGVRWPEVRLLLGSGGPLAHAPDRRQAAAILVDGCRPAGLTELAVDSVFVLPHLGVLQRVAPCAAGDVLHEEAIVPLGACLAPLEGVDAEPGTVLAEVTVEAEQDGEPGTVHELVRGAVARIELPAGKRFVARARPRPGCDLGAGPGQELVAPLTGGPAGLLLDGRGRELPWLDAELARRDQARRWLEILGALPAGLAP
jgi:hypothetical protein